MRSKSPELDQIRTEVADINQAYFCVFLRSSAIVVLPKEELHAAPLSGKRSLRPYEGTVRIGRRVFQRLLDQSPTPERCMEAFHLQRTRFELVVERKRITLNSTASRSSFQRASSGNWKNSMLGLLGGRSRMF